MGNCRLCHKTYDDSSGSIYCSKYCKDLVNRFLQLHSQQQSNSTSVSSRGVLMITQGEKGQVQMPTLSELFRTSLPHIIPIQIPKPLKTKTLALTDAPRNSFEAAFAGYERQALQQFGVRLMRPRDRAIGSMDVYPLILLELAVVFKQIKLDFILYGSAALWLEDRPRPDLTPQQVIKDLDMCVFAKNPKSTEALILETIKKTTAGTVVDWGNSNHVFTSNQGTMEFIAADEGVQFSFNLQSLGDFAVVKKMSGLRKLPLSGMNVSVRCAGLKYIVAGLIGEASMFRKTLFRSDKTLKILTYACLCVGYRSLTTYDVVGELVSFFADGDWTEKTKQLANVSVNRHDKSKTQFYSSTIHLRDKLSQIRTFQGKPISQNYNVNVETRLSRGLSFVDQYHTTRDERAQRVNTLFQQSRNDEMTKEEQTQLRIQISKRVQKNPKDFFLDLYQKKLVQDAVRLWEGEVGTGILIFIMEQLAVVEGIITGCKWISEDHRDKLIIGHHSLRVVILSIIEERLGD